MSTLVSKPLNPNTFFVIITALLYGGWVSGKIFFYFTDNYSFTDVALLMPFFWAGVAFIFGLPILIYIFFKLYQKLSPNQVALLCVAFLAFPFIISTLFPRLAPVSQNKLILAEAIESGNIELCKSMRVFHDKETCFRNVAEKTGNAELCLNIPGISGRWGCLHLLVKKIKNPTICELYLNQENIFEASRWVDDMKAEYNLCLKIVSSVR